MNKQWLLPLLALLIATLACSFSFSTANIANEGLARDEAGNDRTTQFLTDETVYVVMELKNAPDDTTIQALWYAVDVPDVEAETELGRSDELSSGSANVWFSFFPQDGWLPGTYRVDLLLNTIVEKSLTFEVTEANENASQPE